MPILGRASRWPSANPRGSPQARARHGIPRAGGAGAGTGRAVYVGDSDVDIQTAANAGLPCLSVSWGFRDAEFLTAHGAQRIVDTPQALEALLLGA